MLMLNYRKSGVAISASVVKSNLLLQLQSLSIEHSTVHTYMLRINEFMYVNAAATVMLILSEKMISVCCMMLGHIGVI
jgi:hypothetical protein